MFLANTVFLKKLKMFMLATCMFVAYPVFAKESALSLQERIDFLQQNSDRSPFYYVKQGDKIGSKGFALQSRGYKVRFYSTQPKDSDDTVFCSFEETVGVKEQSTSVTFVVPDCIVQYDLIAYAPD